MRTAIVVASLIVAVVGLDAMAAPRITLDELRIEPATLPVGGTFTIHARASAKDVKLGSFLLRTAEEVKREPKIPGLPLFANGKYYAEENGKYFLTDNGPLDRDPAAGVFVLEVSTEGWREGDYLLAFFASSRPADGPFAVARNDLAVSVRSDRVIVEDLGPASANRSRTIKALAVEPNKKIQPGQTVTIALELAGTTRGLELTNPYFIAAEDTQPGFQYDAAKKKSFFGRPSGALIEDNGALDRDAASGKVRLELDTRGWRPGVHHFLLNVVGASGGVVDHRPLAIQVAGAKDQFEVTVDPSSFFMPGTHFNRFLKLRDGTLLSEKRISRDGGRTWQATQAEFGAGGEPLADGRVVGLAYRCLPEEGKQGWYAATRWLSVDGDRFQQDQARFHVPEAKGAMGHGPHPGPLFMRSIVERRDGSLVALMAGWFKSDEALCPYGRGRPYSRSYVCESNDGGATWRYLVTIGYEQLGSEGYNEGSMRRLPSGEILAVLRTGSEQDAKCQDNPIMWSISRDEGRTWTRPARTGLEGAFPSLAVLSDGVIAMSYGRPGAMIAFSTDGGRTWTDPTPVDVTPYSGYTDVVEVAPGELLVGFGAQAWLDPKTGVREDQLRLARVHYRRVR